MRKPLLIFILLTQTLTTHAFTRSEEELLQAEISEAKVRARDFKAHQERMRVMEEERVEFAQEEVVKRKNYEEEQEVVRRGFVVERNARPNVDEETARLELLDLEKKKDEEDRMEQARIDYIRKRQNVRIILEKEAYINEAEEYDLKPLVIKTN